jgi:hypothetical protein
LRLAIEREQLVIGLNDGPKAHPRRFRIGAGRVNRRSTW